MLSALMFDPRLWLYLAVVLVFAIAALMVLAATLIVLAVVAICVSLAGGPKPLYGPRSLRPGQELEPEFLGIEDLTRSQPPDLALGPKVVRPAEITRLEHPTDTGGRLGHEVALVEGHSRRDLLWRSGPH